MSDAPLLTLLGLEELALKAQTSLQLAFVMVNDTRALVEYQQAILYIHGEGIVAVSAVSTVDQNAPLALLLKRIFKAHEAERPLSKEDQAEWEQWLPAHPLYLPLIAPNGTRLGTLLLLRSEQPWEETIRPLLQRITDLYAFVWEAKHRPSLLATWRQKLAHQPRWTWGIAAAIVAVLAFPVRLSVLAPAEVVPSDPAIIRAPLEGIIASVAVTPNQAIHTGDDLFVFDKTTISGKFDIAVKALDSSKAELDQATQQAFFDPKAKASLAVIKAKVDERQAELSQLQDLMERTTVKAPRDGVAVIDDPSAWIGVPVSVGEKVLAVADPNAVEVEAWLAPADMIALGSETPVTLFLNTDPLSPVSATLKYATYEATLQPD